MSGVLLVLGGIAVGLPLLDADAHGKGLGLHGHAPGVEHFKGIPGGVAGAQHQMAAGEGIGAGPAGDGDGGQRTVFDGQVGELAFKADVRPQRKQVFPQVLEGDVEIVGADVGLGVDENVLRGTVGHQRLQNEAVADVLRPGVQLAVGERPGAALTELDVAGEVQLPRGPEAVHVRLPPLHGTAPLQQNGPQARTGQHQGSEQARRPRAHHHRGDLRRGQGGGQEIAGLPFQTGDFFIPAAF